MAKPRTKSKPTVPPQAAPAMGVRGGALMWLAALVVFLCTFFVFLPAMHNEFIDWDDTDNFLRNPDYRGLGPDNLKWMFSTFHMGHYQPLTWLTLGFDYTWGGIAFGEYPEHGYGMDPRSYHLTNVVLHAINAALVFVIARLLIGLAVPTANRTAVVSGAALAALFFGVHPLRVESVAWATERRDLLSGLFLLLSVLSYVHAHRDPQTRRTKCKVAALGFFVLSLLSKVIGVTLPVVLLILDWFPLGRLDRNPARWLSPPNRAVLIEKLPYFGLSFVFSLIATIGQGTNKWLVTLEMHGPFERIVQSMYGLVFYVWKTALPVNLSPLYQMRLPLDVTQPKFIVAAIVLMGLVALLIVFRHRLTSVVATALVYAVMILPVLGLMQNGPQLVADRYSYLPCIGWAVLLGGAIALLWRRLNSATTAPVIALALIVCGTLGWLTRQQIRIWRTTESFWTYIYHFDPLSGYAQNGYGFVLLQRGQLDEAIAALRQAIETYPQNDKAHHNLWIALRRKGDTSALIAAYEAAMPIDAVATPARYELGTLLLEQGDAARAASLLSEALQREPRHLLARTNLGVALMRLNQLPQAIAHLRQAVQIDPDFFWARYNLGLALRQSGARDEALEHLRVAVQLRPDHAGARAALETLAR